MYEIQPLYPVYPVYPVYPSPITYYAYPPNWHFQTDNTSWSLP